MPVCCVRWRYEFRIQRHKIKTRCLVYIWSFQRSVSSHTVECRVVNVLCKNHHIFPNVEWAAVTKQTQQRESGRHQWVYYQFPVIQDSYTIHKSNSLIPNTLLSHTQLDKCVCVLICMSMCIYVYMYIYIYTYIHTHIISFHFISLFIILCTMSASSPQLLALSRDTPSLLTSVPV